MMTDYLPLLRFKLLYSDDGDEKRVVGIATRDMGISKDHTLKVSQCKTQTTVRVSKRKNIVLLSILSHCQPTFQRGVELRSKFTLLGEGARGSLSEEIIKKLDILLLRSYGHKKAFYLLKLLLNLKCCTT